MRRMQGGIVFLRSNCIRLQRREIKERYQNSLFNEMFIVIANTYLLNVRRS